ncbi:MAG: diguanylate cyclase, partial [Fibrobacter sp.]|nr:diguanylate cyclase [Fibrobacter sp.]
GYEVVGCRSGAEALEYLHNNPVELVLLDVNMPEMNGYDVCLNIRKHFPLDDLPIIFLTNQENEASVAQGFQSGASDFVCKSAAPDVLLARIGVHLRLSRSLRNLRDISLTDDLTGAYNRRHAICSLRELFARSKRYGTNFSIVYFDLNGLKRINDQHGHLAGDLLLRSVVTACNKLLRESDMLFRMGGDEFLVICPDTDLKGAFVCAERMQAAVKALTIVDQTVAFAYGTASSFEDYKDMDEMLHSADVSMYECKRKMRAERT